MAHHVSLIGAAVLSAAAALAIQIPDPPQADLAAICATVAALLSTLNIVGGFETKWQANRNAFYDLDSLLLDADDPATSLEDIRKGYKQAVYAQRMTWIAPSMRGLEHEKTALPANPAAD
ncbi:hypothetical protein FB390_6671 [Nocardia bhagyanarayanae]|uniref:SMODS and SLOG-associating 2TM effector domain-containing protein n=1 Tax=Nocardia bhagyanarayanae TaxID=1215925 RepID=A0A543EY39_9NOCA|nr:hypothetical protein FB390_6671 [Nocardia bhagyanarayanae]